jgi:hypothetical protein
MGRFHGPEIEDKGGQRFWVNKLFWPDQPESDNEEKEEKETEKNESASDPACGKKKTNPHNDENAEARRNQAERKEIEADHHVIEGPCLVNDAIGEKKGEAENQHHP